MRHERDAEHLGLLLVPPCASSATSAEIDLARVHAEVGPVHAREVRGGSPTRRSRRAASIATVRRDVVGLEGAVLQRLGVAADRGERCLQLVADRQEERQLGLARLRELLRDVVARDREVASSAAPSTGNGSGCSATGEAAARLATRCPVVRCAARAGTPRRRRGCRSRARRRAGCTRTATSFRASHSSAAASTNAVPFTWRAAKKNGCPFSDAEPSTGLPCLSARCADAGSAPAPGPVR